MDSLRRKKINAVIAWLSFLFLFPITYNLIKLTLGHHAQLSYYGARDSKEIPHNTTPEKPMYQIQESIILLTGQVLGCFSLLLYLLKLENKENSDTSSC